MERFTGTRKLASGRVVSIVNGVVVKGSDGVALDWRDNGVVVENDELYDDMDANLGPALKSRAPRDLPHGTYTLVKPDGGHRTIQIGVAEWTDDKAVVASYLCGPDNELSFKSFAFVKPGGKFSTFKTFREDSDLAGDLETLLTKADIAGAHDAFLNQAEVYALASGKCMRCGRKLTVPTSLHRGLGPVCAGMEGV